MYLHHPMPENLCLLQIDLIQLFMICGFIIFTAVRDIGTHKDMSSKSMKEQNSLVFLNQGKSEGWIEENT